LVNSAGEREPFEEFTYGIIFQGRPRVTDLDAISTLRAVWRGMQHDTHPPLFFLLLNVWRRTVGDGELATRSLSAIFSLLSILPVALLFRRLGRPNAGLLAAGLLALSYGSIHMAQQNRQYSMALFLTASSYLALIIAEDRQIAAGASLAPSIAGRRGAVAAWCTYGMTLFASLMTHYFTVLALAGQAVYAAVRFRRVTLHRWLLACSLAALAMIAIWGRMFLAQQAMIHAQPWLVEAGEGHASKSLLRLADIPIRLLFQFAPFQLGAAKSMAGAAVLAVCALALARRRSREGLLMASWFAVPCIALLIADLATEKQTLNHIRYPVIAVAGLCGIVALAVGELRRPLRELTVAALCLGMFATLRFPTTAHPDAKVAVARLQDALSRDELIIFEAIGWPRDWVPQFFAPVEYYLPDRPNPLLLLRDPPPDELRERLREYRRIWVVSPRIDEGGGPLAPNPLPETHRLAAQSTYIWQIGWVYLFEAAGP
jgi:4-amino-4-deoxy-L-arabinose transferase-like glycosyltransferase